jgi:hypothetical protein
MLRRVRKKAKSDHYIHVSPSTRLAALNNSALNGQIFTKFNTGSFRKYVEKIKTSLKSDKNNGYFT